MFVFGSQLGWFALDGNDGLLPFLANETNSRAVDYVSNLTRFRTLGAEYLLYGRLMRPLDTIPSDISTVDSSCYAKIASAVWRSQGGDLGMSTNKFLSTSNVVHVFSHFHIISIFIYSFRSVCG